MSIKRLFDALERRDDIGRRVAALALPISNRPRVTSSCAGKIGLRQPGEHTSGPNLASRDNVAHNQNLYTILETPGTGCNADGEGENDCGLTASATKTWSLNQATAYQIEFRLIHFSTERSDEAAGL
jgi:hypothetical protein